MHTMCTPHNPRANPKQMNTANVTKITTTLPQTQTIRKQRKSNSETLLHTHCQGSVTAGSCSSPTLGKIFGRLQQLPLRLMSCLMTEEGERGRKKHAYHVHTPQPSRKPETNEHCKCNQNNNNAPSNTNNTKTTQNQLRNTATHSHERSSDCRVVFVSNARQTAATPSTAAAPSAPM
jgi:hypothetical protein